MESTFDHLYPKTADYNEEDIIAAIRQRVSHLLDTQPELLMSYLYRLDVLEKDLKRVLDTSANRDIINEFADLIWKRQKLRMELKEKYKQGPIEGWEY